MNEDFVILNVPHEHVPTVCRLLVNDYVLWDEPKLMVYNSQLSEMTAVDPHRSELRVFGVRSDAPIMRFIEILRENYVDYCTSDLSAWMTYAAEAELEIETAVDLWYEFHPIGSWKMDLRRQEEARDGMIRSARKFVEGWAASELAVVGGK